MTDKQFLLQEEHMKLLRHAYCNWLDVEYGAPRIDPKRPYGSSGNVNGDIRRLLSNPSLTDDACHAIHRETMYALQILLRAGQVKLGTYVAGAYDQNWVVKMSEPAKMSEPTVTSRSAKNESVERALEVALLAHKHRTDHAGQPYILHPIRVAMRFHDPLLQQVGFLHDVVEDTHITLDMLEAKGFSLDVVSSVESLSRRVNEDYFTFIQRVARNPIAARVKLADLMDNMDLTRLAHDDTAVKNSASLMQRYARAYQYLRDLGVRL